MSEYRTYLLNSDAFEVNPLLSDVQISTDADLKKMQYTIHCKMGMKAPLEEVLTWLDAGANLVVTWKDGKKYKLSWAEVVGD